MCVQWGSGKTFFMSKCVYVCVFAGGRVAVGVIFGDGVSFIIGNWVCSKVRIFGSLGAEALGFKDPILTDLKSRNDTCQC